MTQLMSGLRLPIAELGYRVHEVHMILAGLAAIDDHVAREMYDTLRAAYNPSRARGTSPVPPLEEWQGLSSICENLQCRQVWAFSQSVITYLHLLLE